MLQSASRVDPTEIAIQHLRERVLNAPPAPAPVGVLVDYTNNRVAWVRDCIEWGEGGGPTPYQNEVLAKFDAGQRRVAVRGPHALGKTSIAAWLALHFALTRDQTPGDWKVVTTASVWRQLSLFLWPEIHKWARRLKWGMIGRSGPFNDRTELLDLILKLKHGQAFAVASDNPQSIEGAHADHLLYVFDEAKAIPQATWDAAEGALASGDCYALAISTPGEPQGRFYEIHQRKPGYEDWWTRHVRIEECIAAGRVSIDWARQRVKAFYCSYEEIGENEMQTELERLLGVRLLKTTALFSNRVLGEFASSEADGMIPLAWIEDANERWLDLEKADQWGEFTCVGVDVGRGGDASVLALRHGEAIRELRRYGVADTMTVTGYVAGVLRGHGGHAVVDVIGVGAGVVDKLREDKQGVEAFNAGGATDWKDRSGEMLFANKRAAAWWNLRELLDPANGHPIALPPDDLLTGDLTAPHWRPSSGGRIQVESKDEIRKRLGRSTDTGDAVVQAFWTEPIAEEPPFRIARISRSGTRRDRTRETGLTMGGRPVVIKG